LLFRWCQHRDDARATWKSTRRTVFSGLARILLLDEPLAALGAREARLIIGLIGRLRARGDIAIVMIATRRPLEICDRVMPMQHGEVTFESHAAATSAEELLEIVRREYRAVCAG
jgi:ABC-type sugar transport system ATPase subunit